LKPREAFSPLKKSKDGFHSWCKPCLAAARREDRKANPTRYRKIDQKRNASEQRLAANRERWARDERQRALAKKRQLEKRDIYNANRRARLANDLTLRKQRSQANKDWRIKNAERISARRREKWVKATPTQRLRMIIGAAIWRALKKGKGARSWQQLVGYTTTQLIAHLERQFLSGMSWDNYGSEWHIDHIIPASSFQYTTPGDEEFKHCWALTNLRPLWAEANMSKHKKQIYLI
jgi:hypothetical protein